MRRKLISIFLLAALFAPALLTYSWLQYQRHAAKREVKWRILNGIDKSELTYFKFTTAEAENLNWKHSKEFEYQGRMYDIVYREEGTTEVAYWCFNDTEEARINQQIEAFTEQLYHQDPQNRERQQLLIHFYKNLYNQPHSAFSAYIDSHQCKSYTAVNTTLLAGFAARLLQPPIF